MKRGNMRIQNRKGLSTIVATLIIILLTLVAVGIIWVVIRNVVESGAEQVDISQKCLAVELSAVNVSETGAGTGKYSVTLHRGSDAEDNIGVKVNVFNATANSGVLEFGAVGDIEALGTVTKLVPESGATLTGGNKIEFTAYFKDDSGNEQLCSHTYTQTF